MLEVKDILDTLMTSTHLMTNYLMIRSTSLSVFNSNYNFLEPRFLY